MYALIIPALLPFILLGTVMGLAWWEDHVLPPVQPAKAPTEAAEWPAPHGAGLGGPGPTALHVSR
ncbi:hypothetical protein [Streptacidiphilus sp. P02-A3a]|uniref:hypothetical protein n=1 Tax=Streptacidiphilus sp. P02-A3a TaxID=2704468 RepID=UPI0015FB36F5|nr:hypothetical protein [Streptacidiphilus sp. P02-A3a]QMU70006.1 hypothetical protein GXP74_19025 [Streptacidiphilus sp. P02-A3a]